MKDCFKEDMDKLYMKINIDLAPMHQPFQQKEVDKTCSNDIKPGQADYEANCASCHGNPAIGAPVVGNKDNWSTVMAKGIEQVYLNGINGINAMPPKGGTDLSDEK